LCVLIIPVSFTIYSQEPNEQRIKELEDAWLQKARKLSDLGEEIENKKEQLNNMLQSLELSMEELCSDLDAEEKKTFKKTYNNSLNKFANDLYNTLTKNDTCASNIRNFLIQEIINNKTNINDPNFFHSEKMGMLRIFIEYHSLIKLLELYSTYLQALNVIDRDLNNLQKKTPVD
jgi:hypothetical protein